MKERYSASFFFVLVFLFVCQTLVFKVIKISAFQSTSTDFNVNQNIQSISGGNSTNSFSTSTNFNLIGAGGQSGVGLSTSTDFENRGGFLAGMVSQFSTEGEFLTFVIDSNSKSFGIVSPETIASANSSLGITTNNANGFSVLVNRSDSDTTMDLNSDPSVNIPDKTAWNSPVDCQNSGNATASTTETQTLQFRVRQFGTDSLNYCSNWWGSSDNTSGAIFAGFLASAEDIIYRNSSALSQSDSVILYNLSVPVSQKTGDYSGDIVFTAVANP